MSNVDENLQLTTVRRRYAALIARGLGLSESEVQAIELAVELHDIGMVRVPDRIADPSAALHADELAIFQSDARSGHALLQDSTSHFLQMAASMALHHHEQFDGSGYPAGLRGTAIPLEARIVAVVDALDSLTAILPAHDMDGFASAIDQLGAQKARRFDPDLIDVLLRQRDAAAVVRAALLTSAGTPN